MKPSTGLVTGFWHKGRHSLAFRILVAIMVASIFAIIITTLIANIWAYFWIRNLQKNLREHPEWNWSGKDAIEPRFLFPSAVIAGVAAFFFALIVSAFLSTRLSKPIYDLTWATRSITDGEYGRQVKVKGGLEIEELSASFNTLSRSLEKNEILRRNMVADIAHELRTPLATLRGQLEAVQDGVIPPDREAIDSLLEDAAILSRLIEDLQQLSLAEAGQLVLDLMPVDVAETIKAVTTRYEPELVAKNVALTLNIAPDLPLVVADEIRIAQILNNLVRNSLLYTPAGGAIVVGAQRSGSQVIFSVADTGRGIPQEELPYIFERFYRADRSRSRATGGAGLGLSIARSLVESHGGRIWVESEPGEGTTIYFTVPVYLQQGSSS